MNWLVRIAQADLSWILSGPSEDPRIGQETGEPVSDGISVYRDPHGSFRYVYYEGGQPIAGIQVVSDGERANVANVYTLPERQRGGLATILFQRAQADFPNLQHSQHRTEEGDPWITSLGQKSMPLPSEVPIEERRLHRGVDRIDNLMSQETADALNEQYPGIEYGGAGAIGTAWDVALEELIKMKVTHDWGEANAAIYAYENNLDWVVPILEKPKMIQEDPPLWSIRMKELLPLDVEMQLFASHLVVKDDMNMMPRDNTEFEHLFRMESLDEDQRDEAVKVWAHMKYILDHNRGSLWLTDIHGGNVGWDDDGNLKVFDLGPGDLVE